MSLIQALILGLVQGLTEFLPVSSSGHLILVPLIFGWKEQPLAFDAVIHLGTLAAILFALKGDLPKLFEKKCRLGWMIVIASIPALGIGYVFENEIESVLRSPLVVVASLIVWGVLLWVGDRFVKPGAASDVKIVGYQRAIFIGIAQAIALIPGTSRSGVTITAGLFAGLSRETAARFSFLLGIPAIAAAGSVSLLGIFEGTEPVAVMPLAIGFSAAFVSGVIAIRLLLRLLKASTYVPFAVYRIALAVVVFFLLR